MPATTFKLKGLQERKGKIVADIRKLGDVIHKEERGMNADEQEAFNKLKTDLEAVNASITAANESAAALNTLLAGESGGEGEGGGEGDPAMQENARRVPGTENRSGRPKPRGGDGPDAAQIQRDRRLAFRAWARAQHGRPISDELRDACRRTGLSPRAKIFEFRIGGPGSRLQRRAQSVGTTTAGGYTVAEDFSGAMESALVDYSNVRGVVDEFTTTTGADMPWPTEDDTSNTGEQIGENTETSFADTSFGVVTFKAYKFSSKGILISHELLNDSEFNLEAFLGEQAGIRIGRIQGQRFTTGTGTLQPKGIVTCSTLGKTSAGATAITADELTQLAFSIDKAYRNSPKFGYMMHDTIFAYVLLLKDGENRPLLRESYRDGIQTFLLNGFQVATNQFMAAAHATTGLPVTATKSVVCGDMAKMKVRDVGGVRLRRLDERYAEKDQVGFVAFQRSDSNCVNTAAIKHLLQA